MSEVCGLKFSFLILLHRPSANLAATVEVVMEAVAVDTEAVVVMIEGVMTIGRNLS